MSKVTKYAIGLMIATVLSKFSGFVRELVLGATYGASNYSDIYITAMNIPTVLFSTIGIAIGTTFIPIYYDNHSIGGDKKGLEFTNNILNIVLAIGVVMAITAIIFAEPLVKAFAIGFQGESLKTTILFTRIMIFGGLFICLANIMTSFLQIKNNFIVPGLIGLPFNIIIIISIILSASINIYILPIGTLIAMFSQFLFQYPFARKNGYKYSCKFNIKDEYIKKMIWLVAPVFIGVAVNQINAMVDRTLASTLAEGSISALNYANKLNGFIMALFITSIGAVIYPMLSKISIKEDKKQFTETVVKSVNSVILLVIPISIGAIVLSKPIVKILFERGAFDTVATSMTSKALIFYSIGMVAFGLQDILGKVFYSIKDTKTPMINGAIAMVLNIVFNISIIKFMGIAGLALGTSIATIICTVLLFRSLNKKIGYFGQDKIIKTLAKTLISSIAMGGITYFVYNSLNGIMGQSMIINMIKLSISVGIGVITYGCIIIKLKVEEVNDILDIIKKKLNRRG